MRNGTAAPIARKKTARTISIPRSNPEEVARDLEINDEVLGDPDAGAALHDGSAVSASMARSRPKSAKACSS